MIEAVLLDLDGVIRHFDAEVTAEIEGRNALALGSLLDAAFAEPAITEVTTGRISRVEWLAGIGEAVGSPEAATEWGGRSPAVDESMLVLADELRARGVVVGVLTNGTDTVRVEVESQGIACRVDHLFNRAEIGLVKPDPAVFRHVLDVLGLPAPAVFFTDDSPPKLAGAVEVGMVTHEFVGPAELRQELVRLEALPPG